MGRLSIKMLSSVLNFFFSSAVKLISYDILSSVGKYVSNEELVSVKVTGSYSFLLMMSKELLRKRRSR